MADIQHYTLTDPYLHEPKEISTAAEGKVYVADGAGSGTWHYLPTGWGYYKDNAASQVFNSTPALITNDGLGATTDTTKLPYEIRASGALWAGNKITPVNAGDSYDVSLDLPVTTKTGSPTELTIELDIGGSVYSSAITIVERYETTAKNTPYVISMAFPIFCGTTFLANGGQFWAYTDTGTITVDNPSIYIGMNTNGDM